MDSRQLTGRTDNHVTSTGDPTTRMLPQVLSAYEKMRAAAAVEGIDLVAVSAFRDFGRQATLWNRKWRGERPLFDRHGRRLNARTLPADERVHAILTWSALPGASRHHWGTDLDVIDEAALPKGYAPHLLPTEFLPGGPFHRLHVWLKDHAERFGFFFPYRSERNGVSPEPWHISYAPVSVPALDKLTPELLREVIEESDLAGKKHVLPMIPEIHARYVRSVDS